MHANSRDGKTGESSFSPEMERRVRRGAVGWAGKGSTFRHVIWPRTGKEKESAKLGQIR